MHRALLSLVFSASLAACGASESVTVEAEPASASAAVATTPDFTDEEGQLLCPIMGEVIPSKEQAVSHLEHQGMNYWFCCDSCEKMFADDPDRYADGTFLTHVAAEHDGQFWDCFH